MTVNESDHHLIFRLERLLQQPEIRTSPTEFAGLLTDDFIEYGSSGRIYDKKAIVESVAGQECIRIEMADFKTRQLAADIILATYHASIVNREGEPPSQSLRSSIWKHSDGQWLLCFHQGTSVHD